MSVVKKFLLGAGGAALLATGVASTAHAQPIGADPCDMYAREYAAVHAPQFGFGGWDAAYRHAYNACLAGGPTFVEAPYTGPFGWFGAALSAPFHVAGAAVHAGTTVAGTALAAPATIAAGTAAALAPPPVEPVAPATTHLNPPVYPTPSEPTVMRNFQGSFEVN